MLQSGPILAALAAAVPVAIFAPGGVVTTGVGALRACQGAIFTIPFVMAGWWRRSRSGDWGRVDGQVAQAVDSTNVQAAKKEEKAGAAGDA